MKSAFILSAYTAGLGVIRALGAKGVPLTVGYSDPIEMGRKSKYVQQLHRLPDAEQQEQDFIDCLLSDAVGTRGELLIPTSDATLAAVSRHKEALLEKYQVACPEWRITGQFLDKKNTASLAEQAGVPAPKTFVPHQIEDIEAWGPLLQFPCLAKPSQVHIYNRYFARKMTRVENLEALYQAFREAQQVGVELMIQEFIPGEDSLGANYNAYYWEGEPLVEFTARKIRNAPPAMGSPAVLISEKIPEVMESGRRILGAAGYSGYACSEFKRDPRDGIYKLMEVNARHNLSTALAVRCGLNFPWLHYQHLMEGIAPQARDYETGVYWIDVSRDVGFRLVNLGKENLSLQQFVTPYVHTNVFAVLDWCDPAPAAVKAMDTLKAAFSYLTHTPNKKSAGGAASPSPLPRPGGQFQPGPVKSRHNQ